MSTSILLLDEEQGMFKAINRLVRPLEAVVFATHSVEHAMDFCHSKEVHLIITDINRHDVDVNEFLRNASATNPLTRKMVLTSFAELDSTADAINEGKINRYFTKPWDPIELRAAIAEELEEYETNSKASKAHETSERRANSMEKKASLTSRMLEGTAELLQSAKYRAAIEMLGCLLEQRKPGSMLYAKRVAKTANKMCKHIGLSVRDNINIEIAAELHQIGYLGLPDSIINKKVSELSISELNHYQQYPVLGEATLTSDQIPDDVAGIIRHHRENFQGGGYPDRMVARFIPLGARIVRIAADFHEALKQLSKKNAIEQLQLGAGTVYDPELIEILVELEGLPLRSASNSSYQVRIEH